MYITYSKPNPKLYQREVFSKQHDECLTMLENLKEFGIIIDIDKRYYETGWTLIGITRSGQHWCYTYSGTWEEVSETETEVELKVEPEFDSNTSSIRVDDRLKWEGWVHTVKQVDFEDLK